MGPAVLDYSQGSILQARRPLARNEKRMGFRVLVADLPEHVQRRIHAQITHGDETSPVSVVDLSLSGMLVSGLRLNVGLGDRVRVQLEYEGRSTALEGAIVRKLDRDSFGIHFPESVRNGQFDPPVRLSNLHRPLERMWLQSRGK